MSVEHQSKLSIKKKRVLLRWPQRAINMYRKKKKALITEFPAIAQHSVFRNYKPCFHCLHFLEHTRNKLMNKWQSTARERRKMSTRTHRANTLKLFSLSRPIRDYYFLFLAIILFSEH